MPFLQLLSDDNHTVTDLKHSHTFGVAGATQSEPCLSHYTIQWGMSFLLQH